MLSFFLGLFSESTAHALQLYSDEYPELLQTYKFVQFVGNLWKIMSLNLHQKVIGLLKYLVFSNA